VGAGSNHRSLMGATGVWTVNRLMERRASRPSSAAAGRDAPLSIPAFASSTTACSADYVLRRLNQFHPAVPRAVQHQQFPLRIAEYENIAVAKMRLFNRFFQRHGTKRH
jgi:hypothetical protein